MTTGAGRKRQSPEVRAARAMTLLDNPELRATFDTVRSQLIADIEAFPLDGTDVNDMRALELVRRLQSLIAVKRTILMPVITEQIRSGNLRV
ncbi:MAG: hypothetical protein WC790_00370 [Candidatus Paceibacterota bacterium]|jgi:hypothetical protein